MNFGSFIKRSADYRSIAILGAFEKLRKAAINLVTSVCLSVRPSVCMEELTRPPLEGFSLNFIFEVS